ncbi:MAG: hypothetical protein LBV12_01495 [Puniceicoccales bacterium]|jgi:hypothetical protein|nr:hypothetical protein [Puniceicoccales bacterium]
MAARLVDYEGAKTVPDSGQPKKSGCIAWFIILAVILIIGAITALVFVGVPTDNSENTYEIAVVADDDASDLETNSISVQTTEPTRAKAEFIAPYTLTVQVNKPVHVKITQQADGKILVNETIKPAIPINTTAQSAIVVESESISDVSIQIGNHRYAASDKDAQSFIVVPK